MEKVVLLQEQVEYLKNRKEKLENLSYEGKIGYDAVEASTKKKNGINKVDNLLNNHVVASGDDNHITIGSVFDLTIKDQYESSTEKYVLAATNIGLTDANVITVESSLGKVLINRQVGDIIKYNVGPNEMTATVNKIYSKTQKTFVD